MERSSGEIAFLDLSGNKESAMPHNILIVDDEKDMLVLLGRILSEAKGYTVTGTEDSRKVEKLLETATFDLVLSDLKMPHVDGLHVLEMVKTRSPRTAVVIMTAYGTIDSAIEATRKGAFDYITKPFRKERILQVAEQALKWQELEMENQLLREQLEEKPRFSALVGKSRAMRTLQEQIAQVAKTAATILITGESGTGKELVARAIHGQSLRSDRPLIPVNCSTIPETLIESELFGHVRGSFTGALKDKRGLVDEADKGTLFLDEIGDISPTVQIKLLRLVQEGEFKVVGDTRIRTVDIRFVAATHQDLQVRIRAGEFREDLFYRLNVINIHLPSLRERSDDIPILAHHFLRKFVVLHGKKNVHSLSPEALDRLTSWNWPGNIRELENVIERGVIMAQSDLLRVEDLGMPSASGQDRSVTLDSMHGVFDMPFKEAKDKLMDDFQTSYISKMLTKHGGNVSQAAKDSGVKRQYLHRLMRDNQVASKNFKK
jgi:DNA-binding NtrC family response regulator